MSASALLFLGIRTLIVIPAKGTVEKPGFMLRRECFEGIWAGWW